MRRSAADGRDSYYSLDLARCETLLRGAGQSLHPSLTSVLPKPPAGAVLARVLFLCTGNSARSQMAEALMTQLSGGAVEAASAGSRPKSLHPLAVLVMRQRGIDVSGRRSKHVSEFAGERFDRVITLCDRVREVCPEFTGTPELIHWSIPEPDDEAAFARTARELSTRIGFLIDAINSEASAND
jgi:protein-tyrosine-phosphatase